MTGPHGDAQTSGLALLPVVLVLLTVGSIAFLLNRQAAMQTEIAAHSAGLDEARYVAEAGLEHERWLLNQANCTGYTNLASTALGNSGNYSYSASVTPTLDSPVAITAVGILADGATQTLSRANIKIYAAPTTLTLQPDATQGKDTLLSEFKQTWNYGTSNALEVDGSGSQKHSLLQFDLSAISNAMVLSATLDLYQDNAANAGGIVAVHRMLSSWIEGTQSGGAGASNWTERDAGVPWAAPGGDFDVLASASTTLAAGTVGWFQWNVSSLVSGWVDGSYNNDGLALVGDRPLIDFTSSDSNNAVMRVVALIFI